MPTQPKPSEVNAFNSAQEALCLLSEREAEAALALAYAASAKQDMEIARKFQAAVNGGLDAKHRE